MKRRQFTKAAGLGLLAPALVRADDTEEVIDIHQHVNFSGRSNEDFFAHQEKMGVSHTVLLPSASAYSRKSTHDGKSNGLAARIFGTMAAARIVKAYPDRFSFFCNEIPDIEEAPSELAMWLERGAIGIGESKFHLECDSAPMFRLYEIAQEYKVPILLHFEHNRYNMGFERFGKVLEKFPKVNFIGHAQTWWGNIDADHVQKEMYPKKPVKAGGLTDRYLSDYPNMFGDLSAGSGRNALARDEEHARGFLERHQDKLLLGTDCSDSAGSGSKCSGSQQIANVRRLSDDKEAKRKILAQNAKKLLGLG